MEWELCGEVGKRARTHRTCHRSNYLLRTGNCRMSPQGRQHSHPSTWSVDGLLERAIGRRSHGCVIRTSRAIRFWPFAPARLESAFERPQGTKKPPLSVIRSKTRGGCGKSRCGCCECFSGAKAPAYFHRLRQARKPASEGVRRMGEEKDATPWLRQWARLLRGLTPTPNRTSLLRS